MSAAAYNWITKDVTRNGKSYKWRYRVRDRSGDAAKPAKAAKASKAPPSTAEGAPKAPHAWVEKSVTRGGKTHRQWFRVKGVEPVAKEPAKEPAKEAPKEKHESKEKEASKEEPKVEKSKAETTPSDTNPKETIEKLSATLPKWDKADEMNSYGKNVLSEKERKEQYSSADQKFTKLDQQQVKAITAFTDAGEGFGLIRAMQQGKTDTELQKSGVDSKKLQELRASLPHLEAAQEALGVDNPTSVKPLWRGLKVDEATLHSLLTSDTFTHKAGSNSTTYDADVAGEFSRTKPPTMSVVLKYSKVKRAAGVMFSSNDHQHENEMIVGKGTFKVKRRAYDKTTKGYLIELEEQ